MQGWAWYVSLHSTSSNRTPTTARVYYVRTMCAVYMQYVRTGLGLSGLMYLTGKDGTLMTASSMVYVHTGGLGSKMSPHLTSSNCTSKPCKGVISCMRKQHGACAEMGLAGSLYLTGNDGTLMSGAEARRLPLHTFQSGPVNSLRGAAKLSGLSGVHLSISRRRGGGGGGQGQGLLRWRLGFAGLTLISQDLSGVHSSSLVEAGLTKY